MRPNLPAFTPVLLLFIGCVEPVERLPAGMEQAIVGGEPAVEGQYPSVVSLEDEDGHSCGGTLIAPEWVLTAGHCVDEGPTGGITAVRAGVLTRSSSDGDRIPVLRVYVHPEYDYESLPFAPEHDIALVRLARAASVPPAALVDQKVFRRVRPGTPAQVVGFGLESEEAIEGSDVLRHASVPVRSQKECRAAYGRAVTANMLCAGYDEGGIDACSQDSGGPLFVTLHGVQTQIGIVSAGWGCALPGWYGIYTNVAAHRHWMADVVEGDEAALSASACAEGSTCGDPGDDARPR